MNAYHKALHRTLVVFALLLATLTPGAVSLAADTTLSDLPLYSATNVPANLMLALSVEFPTGTVAAYTDGNGIPVVTGSTSTNCSGLISKSGQNWGACFFPKQTYLGYFDPLKCYSYAASDGYFKPSKKLTQIDSSCAGDWSGNMLNWATMTALDEFRQTLTGGARDVDQAANTVLVRSNLNSQSNQDNFPNKILSSSYNVAPSRVVGDSALRVADTLYIRSYALGNSFRVSTDPKFGTYTQFNAKVQVCAKNFLESNCTQYGSNYKPEGLIQQNYQRIRVGASAYASTNGRVAPNGVVRALLRDNGPTKYSGVGARPVNEYREWSADDGTFIVNPASADSKLAKGADGTPFSQSGVINYLNKFGANGYETFDTISELYWATLAYYMRQKLDPKYTDSLATTGTLDNAFPVFKGTAADASDSNDPMQYRCAANAILVIGDSHTHCDQRVPSSSGPAPNNTDCKMQAPLSVVAGVDASAATTKIGDFPLIEADGTGGSASSSFSVAKGKPNLGTQYLSGDRATYMIAGLAYFAHTTDIRSDAAMTGKQTVDTYIVDVMEPGTFSGSSGNEIYAPGTGSAGPNQYWMAAKYGGFSDYKGDGKPASFLSWHTNTSTAANKDLRPDNYFVGNRPDLISAGLSSIFSSVSTSASLSASGPSVSPTRVLSDVVANTAPYNSNVAGFPIYEVSYAPGTWSGDVTGKIASAPIGSDIVAVTGSRTWSAQGNLDQLGAYVSTDGSTVGWRDLRRVFTRSSAGGVPFTWSSLDNTQQGNLARGSDLVDFLVGDRSKEGAKFRIRSHLLGDIVNSQATLVQGAQSTSYTDANNPGYNAFRTTSASRKPVVYVGANDGMLHAFSADFQAAPGGTALPPSGAELWAYVPNLVIAGPSGDPTLDGIAALGNLNGVTANRPFVHHFYVDQTPQVADVDFTWAINTPGKAGARPAGSTPDWHTVLVGGLGKGGKGIYALDVTTVDAAPTTTKDTTIEAAIAKKRSLWEFTASTMGYSYARPLIAKTRKYGWVVILTSGYNNADGKGYLYILNVKTGTLLETLVTSSGSTANPIGLSRPSAYIKDVSDNTVEQVYAGDLQGNVWRFDLSGTSDYPAPVVIATLTDAKGKAQPITTAPRIELDYNSAGSGTRRWVFVGTGKYLDTSDLTDTQVQSMYALRDGTGDAPATVTTPIARTNLVKNSLVTALNIQDADKGWYYDLTGVSSDTGGATERIVVDPDAVAGIFSVNWGTLIPTADPCSLAGAVYSANYGSGLSNFTGSDNAPIPFKTTNTAVTNLQMVQLPGSNRFVLLYGQTGEAAKTADLTQPGAPPQLQRTNWRELLD